MDGVLENLNTYGYLILFLYSLSGGQVGLIAAALLSVGSKFDINLCVLIGFLGNAIGTNLTFLIAKYCKKDFMIYLKKHRRKVALGIVKFRQYNTFFIFIHKYIYGFKTIIPIVAGIVGYSNYRFLILNTIASLIWAIVVGYLFYYLANIFNIDEIKQWFEGVTDPYILIAIVVCICIIAYVYFSKVSKKQVR